MLSKDVLPRSEGQESGCLYQEVQTCNNTILLVNRILEVLRLAAPQKHEMLLWESEIKGHCCGAPGPWQCCSKMMSVGTARTPAAAILY